MMRIQSLFLGALLVAGCASAQSPGAKWTLALLPAGGAISGPPSSTIGWGYSITNQSSTDWLVITGLNAGVFTDATPDASYFDFPILPPNTTVTVAFSASSITGLYALTWDALAPVGIVNSGNFVVSGEWWTGDPFGGGSLIEDAPDQAAPYSATVKSSVGPPSCHLTSTIAGPPKQLVITMQDINSGLQSIQPTESVNASVSIPVFFPGTTDAVAVTATKIDQTLSSHVAFTVTDMAGLVTSCDPVDFTISLTGAIERYVFRKVMVSEHYIRIVNGTPGVRQIRFFVNGIPFFVPVLKDGQTYNLDIESALSTTAANPSTNARLWPETRRGFSNPENQVVLYAFGQSGASAYVLIGDASVE